MPSFLVRIRLMLAVAPTRRLSRSSRKPLLIASEITSAHTPAVTPTMEITVATEMAACRRLAFKYRKATKNSNRMAIRLYLRKTAFDVWSLERFELPCCIYKTSNIPVSGEIDMREFSPRDGNCLLCYPSGVKPCDHFGVSGAVRDHARPPAT